jgi:hypothetical protein
MNDTEKSHFWLSGDMMRVLSTGEIQATQMLIGFAMAALVGCRFLPSRWRQFAGIALTIAYIAGGIAGLLYLLTR